MPQSVQLGSAPGSYLFQEFTGPAGTGSVIAPVGAVTYSSDTATVATIDPNSGQLAYIGVGTANISGADAGNGLTATDQLTVTAATAQSATLTFVPPAAASSGSSAAASTETQIAAGLKVSAK
jgi:hypothetical protein